MKYSDLKLQPFISGNIEIGIEEEFTYWNWWKSFDNAFVYSADKTASIAYSALISLRNEGDVEGYFVAQRMVFDSPIGNCKAFDVYMSLKEFGFCIDDKDKATTLMDYLFYYAKTFACKWIAIPKHENFPAFYDFVASYCKQNDTNAFCENNVIYLEIPSPIEYEDVEHFCLYKEDGINFFDLTFMQVHSFELGKDYAVRNLGDAEIKIDRRTKQIFLPATITHSTPLFIGENTYPLLNYLCFNYYIVKNSGLVLDNSFSDVPFLAYALGDSKAITFENIEQENGYLDYLLTLKNKYNIQQIGIYPFRFFAHELRWISAKNDYDLEKEIETLKSCLDVEGATKYLPFGRRKAIEEMNAKLDKVIALSMQFGAGYPIKLITIDFINQKLYVANEKGVAEAIRIDKAQFIRWLKSAYFSNWTIPYIGDDDDGFEWFIKLDLEGEKKGFAGCDATPKVWKYWFGELEDFIKKNTKGDLYDI